MKLQYIYLVFISFIFFIGCDVSKKSVEKTTSASDNQDSVISGNTREEYFLIEASKHKNLGDQEKAIYLLDKLTDFDSTNATAYYMRSQVLAENRNYPGAIKSCKRAITLDSQNKWYHNFLINLYLQNDEKEQALSAYNNLIEIFPEAEKYYLKAAKLARSIKEFNVAINYYNDIIEKFGKNPTVLKGLATSYYDIGEFEKSYDILEKATEEYPENIEVLGLLAEFYSQNNKMRAANRVYQKALKADKDNGKIFISIAVLKEKIGQLDSAYYYLKRGFSDPDINPRVKTNSFVNTFNSYLGDKSYYRDNKKVLQTLVDLHKSNVQSNLIYIEFLWKHKQFHLVQDLLEDVINKKKDDFNIWERLFIVDLRLEDYQALYNHAGKARDYFINIPRVYYFHGLGAFFTERYNTSVESFQYALDLSGSNFKNRKEVYIRMAEAYHAMGNYEKETEYFNKVLSIDPDNVFVKNNFSFYLAKREQNLDKALSMIEDVIGRNPNNHTYLDTYAWVLFKREEYSKALGVIKKAVKNGGNSSNTIIEHYGDILFKNGKTDLAVQQWEKAYNNNSSDKQLQKKIESKSLNN